MPQYDKIAAAFVRGESVKKSWSTKFKTCNSGMNNPFGIPDGVRKMSVDEQAGKPRLRSYERMTLALKFKDFVLVNGDKAPTKTTKEQQDELLHALNREKVPYCLLPFSALRAAGIPEYAVRRVHTTEDKYVTKEVPCRRKFCEEPKPHTHERREHFLGETLFRYGTDYYVSGLDRNDDPADRHFYLAKLPARKRPPKTVDEALEMLRPKTVPKGSPRQGEWFFVPAPTPRGAPLVHTKHPLGGRAGRHVAERCVQYNDARLVAGRVFDTDHATLVLEKGVWYRPVRNLAAGSWNAVGDVD